MIENRTSVLGSFIEPFVAEKTAGAIGFKTSRGLIVHPSIGMGEAGYDISLGEAVEANFWWNVNSYVLEIINMPTHLTAHVQTKSTIAREGIHLNTTRVDPGWPGRLTIEILYKPTLPEDLKRASWPMRALHWLRHQTVELPRGLGIGSLEFHQLVEPRDYRQSTVSKYSGTMQTQEAI
jgi:hypothetical protein